MSRIPFAFALTSMAVIFVAQGQARPIPDSPGGQVDVPAVPYESAFKGYRKLEDQPVASWRDANDLVHRLGGWKAFASGKVPDDPQGSFGDAKPGQSTDQASPTQSRPSPATGHAGHKTQ